MKVLSAILTSLIIFAYSFGIRISAVADNALFYARAQIRNAYFCSDKNLSAALFSVPYTYCVLVLAEEGDWYYVKYAEDVGAYRAIYGYCLRSDLTPLRTKPDVTYLYKEIRITYSVGGNFGSLPSLNELTVTAAYYGAFFSGPSAYSYVFCQGTFGYVEGANDDYELAETDNSVDGASNEQPKTQLNGKLIAGIALFGLAAISILILLMTGNKKFNE